MGQFDKLVWCSEEENKELQEKFGYNHYNHAPSNWKEVDEEWLAKKSTFRVYGFKYHWFQQITDLPDEKYMLSVHCFGSYDGTGFAISTDYWGGKVRYFSFAGCLHEYEGLNQQQCRELGIFHGGRCYHVSKCKKCGFVMAYDSSD